MARSMAELEKLRAELEAEMQEAAGADDDELWVERNGTRFLLKGPKASAARNKLKDLWEEIQEEAEEEAEEIAEKPAAKKVAAKKTASRKPKPVEEEIEELEEELEEDDQPAKPRHFWE